MPRPQSLKRHFTLFLLVAAAATAVAQSPTAPASPPTFEIASIRQNLDRQVRWRMSFTANGLSAEDVTLQYVMEEAYNLYDAKRWSGGPSWLGQRRFNIEARFDPAAYKNITADQRRAMLQQLLADRFQLAVHHEPNDLPVYALVVAKHGPKLATPKPADLNPETIYGSTCQVARSRPDHLEMKDCTMHDFVSVLTAWTASDLGRNIVDRTGLTGHYNFDFSWSPENPAAAARLDSDAPTVFTALKKELGLQLKPSKGMLDTIVIDHVEMPSPN